MTKIQLKKLASAYHIQSSLVPTILIQHPNDHHTGTAARPCVFYSISLEPTEDPNHNLLNFSSLMLIIKYLFSFSQGPDTHTKLNAVIVFLLHPLSKLNYILFTFLYTSSNWIRKKQYKQLQAHKR